MAALLKIENLCIEYPSKHSIHSAVNNFCCELNHGEILGLVGESGAGKSTVGQALVGLVTAPGRISGGDIYLCGEKISGLSCDELRSLRGSKIGFIFQNPMTALNPLLTIGQQITESINTHLVLGPKLAKVRAISLMEQVGIPRPEHRFKQYPHQFSGGMLQRIVIAIALAGEPDLIIADEPTTALDVAIQDQILVLIRELCVKKNMGCLFITHDMAVVQNITDRVAVMYKGNLVEVAKTADIFQNPQAEYTKNLIAAVPPPHKKIDRFTSVQNIEAVEPIPTLDVKQHWLGKNPFEIDHQGPMLSCEDINLRFLIKPALLESNREYVQACKNINFEIMRGETLGLVGESGSGKSTLARIICGLYNPDSGSIKFADTPLNQLAKKYSVPLCCLMQMVFQCPYTSMNPRMKVFDIIAEPIKLHRLADSNQQIASIVNDLLEHVGLGHNAGSKYPHEFSGGQCQRISMARALATRPKLLICDEPTSALDVSVQAQILNLLKDLQQELDLTILFVSHDLPVIRQMCDRIGVMRQGQLLEIADSESWFASPQHSYSQQLIEYMPKIIKSNHDSSNIGSLLSTSKKEIMTCDHL